MLVIHVVVLYVTTSFDRNHRLGLQFVIEHGVVGRNYYHRERDGGNR